MPFTLQFSRFIAASPQRVFAELSDPRNMVGLQPLLSAVTDIDSQETPSGKTIRYRTTEVFRLGPWPVWRNHIQVTTVIDEHHLSLCSEVISPGGVSLRAEYQFSAEDTGTRLTEIMTVNCPSLLRGFVTRTATRVQTATLDNLNQRLTTTA